MSKERFALIKKEMALFAIGLVDRPVHNSSYRLPHAGFINVIRNSWICLGPFDKILQNEGHYIAIQPEFTGYAAKVCSCRVFTGDAGAVFQEKIPLWPIPSTVDSLKCH